MMGAASKWNRNVAQGAVMVRESDEGKVGERGKQPHRIHAEANRVT